MKKICLNDQAASYRKHLREENDAFLLEAHRENEKRGDIRKEGSMWRTWRRITKIELSRRGIQP